MRLRHRPQRVAAEVKRRRRGFRPRLTFGAFSASFRSARAGSRLYRCRVMPSDSPSVTKKTARWSKIFIGFTWKISHARLSWRISRNAVNSAFSDTTEITTAQAAASRNTAASSAANRALI